MSSANILTGWRVSKNWIIALTNSQTDGNLAPNFYPSLHWLIDCSWKSKSKSHCDWLSVSQSVSKSWCRAPSGAHDQIFISVWQLRSCFRGAPSLTRGRVCLLYVPLILASAVSLGSESRWTRDHILLSQIWDFNFCRLLRLAGSRWRYSTPSSDGYQLKVKVKVTLRLTSRQGQHRKHGSSLL
jgi:hypothetical protein